MAARKTGIRDDVTCADDLACDLFDVPFDLDALSGDWFTGGVDPHYSELPCYVPLVDDDGLAPFIVEVDVAWPPMGPQRNS